MPVAKALRKLGFNVTWVGSAVHQDVPPKGASDEQVIAFAAKTNQVIVTSNHDMMLLCHEANQRFVWIDPRGRQLSREQQVVLCFSQIARWEEILGDDTEVCVRALRTRRRRSRAAKRSAWPNGASRRSSESVAQGSSSELPRQNCNSFPRRTKRNLSPVRCDVARIELAAVPREPVRRWSSRTRRPRSGSPVEMGYLEAPADASKWAIGTKPVPFAAAKYLLTALREL